MKRTPLRSNPDRVREWQQRSRKPLASGTPKVREPIPMETRVLVKARSGGWCVACLARHGLFALDGVYMYRSRIRALDAAGVIRRIAHLHHVLPVATFPQWTTRRENLVGVCAQCHDDAERANRRIPYAALPREVREFTAAQGARETAFMARSYPR